MRTLETIPHPDFLISVMHMNQKFILKIEAGPYEQIYKFTAEMAPDIESVRKKASPEFLAEVKKIFDGMHANLVREMHR